MGAHLEQGARLARMPITTVFVSIECRPHVVESMARFYAGMLEVEPTVVNGDPEVISEHVSVQFETSPDHEPPTWPSQERGVQAHLDLYYPDEAEYRVAIERAESLGGRRAATQNDENWWTVFLDPAGHPLCVCRVA